MSTSINTSAWVDVDENGILNLTDGLGVEEVKDIAHPVMFKNDNDRVYSLDSILKWKERLDRDDRPFFNPCTREECDIKDLQPVRYPGFRGYRSTVEMCKEHFGRGWEPEPDVPGAPSVEAGERMVQLRDLSAREKIELKTHKRSEELRKHFLERAAEIESHRARLDLEKQRLMNDYDDSMEAVKKQRVDELAMLVRVERTAGDIDEDVRQATEDSDAETDGDAIDESDGDAIDFSRGGPEIDVADILSLVVAFVARVGKRRFFGAAQLFSTFQMYCAHRNISHEGITSRKLISVLKTIEKHDPNHLVIRIENVDRFIKGQRVQRAYYFNGAS